MKNRVRFFFLFLGLLGALAVHAQINELPRSTPEAEGVPSKAVTALFDSLMALPKTDIHSVVVLRHGKVIGEIYPAPFAPEYRHTMYSCSKTFVGAAVGLAIADNRLRLTDRVGAFFPELLPDSVSANLADMTVRDHDIGCHSRLEYAQPHSRLDTYLPCQTGENSGQEV